MVWSRKVIFRKSQKLLTERALSKLHRGGLFIKFKSYSFNFNGGLRKHRAGYCLLRTPGQRGKQFLRFLKTDLLRFHSIYLLFDWIKLLFFYMCLLRKNLHNMCQNMNHFDAVDFSEWHSEEVISFFWRSVYIPQPNLLSAVMQLFIEYTCTAQRKTSTFITRNGNPYPLFTQSGIASVYMPKYSQRSIE